MPTQQVIGGRYELTVPIGSGGMGEVWEAYDRSLDRRVAVKLLRRARLPAGSDPHKAAQRFAREARATARLDHPGVPVIFDVGADSDDLFIVMQRLEGWGLGDLISERGRLPVRWAAAIAAQICSVLAAAHAASLVHRDLKPSNVMVCPGGTVRVLDFGVAALLDSLDSARLTASGETIGTPAYMAPEQARTGQSSPRSDLYALGCLLHEMLAGGPVFDAATSYGLMQAHLAETPVPLRRLRENVPEGLQDLVLELLAKEPDQRPAEAADVHARLLPLVVDTPTTPDCADALDPTRVYIVPRGLSPLPRLAARTGDRVAPGAVRGDEAQPPASEAAAQRELQDARRQAAELVDTDRFTQAAEVLDRALAPLPERMMATDALALGVRLDLADLLMIAGNHRRALRDYELLVADLGALLGADDAAVLRCRGQAAACMAALGETADALERMQELLHDYERASGSDDPEVLDLRYQIGLLLATTGDTARARQILSELVEDQERVLGPHDPSIDPARQLLSHLRQIAPE